MFAGVTPPELMSRRFAAAWLALGCWLIVVAPGRAADERPLEVAASIGPLAELAERVGGELVRVGVLTPPATPPESWAPTPREALALARADLYLSVGHRLLSSEATHLEAVARGSERLERIAMTVVADPASLEDPDPHLWMDLDVLVATAERFGAWLVGRRQDQRLAVAARLEAYLETLGGVDALLAERLAVEQRRPAIFQHPAWERLLDRYGVESETIEAEGKEASPARLVALVEASRDRGVRSIFSQIGVSDRGARLLAREIGAEVVPLDPTSRQWLETISDAGSRIAEAIR